jgi:hypothetical protein
MEKLFWEAKNYGSGKRKWFLYDADAPAGKRYRCDKRGHVIHYASMEAAQIKADKEKRQKKGVRA